MSAVARLAETTIIFEPSKWFFGGFAMLVFVALIVVVTRCNMDR